VILLFVNKRKILFSVVGFLQSPSVCEQAMDTSVKVAHILLDAGCDVSQTTNVGKTPVSLALEQVSGIKMAFHVPAVRCRHI
jgi:hypothetical protein